MFSVQANRSVAALANCTRLLVMLLELDPLHITLTFRIPIVSFPPPGHRQASVFAQAQSPQTVLLPACEKRYVRKGELVFLLGPLTGPQ